MIWYVYIGCRQLPARARQAHLSATYCARSWYRCTFIVLQRVAVYFIVLQRVAVYSIVLLCVAVCSFLAPTARDLDSGVYVCCCSELQRVAVCCGTLQCVELRRSVLVVCHLLPKTVTQVFIYRVAVCCGVLRYVAVCRSVLRCAAVCRSVSQCVAVCCCVLLCVAVCSSVFGVCCLLTDTLTQVHIYNDDLCGGVLQCLSVSCSVLLRYHICIHMYVWVCVKEVVCTCVCVCVCVCVYICVHTSKVYMCLQCAIDVHDCDWFVRVIRRNLYMGHDSFICGTWLIHAYDMTHTRAVCHLQWGHPWICVTVTHSYMWYSTIYICDMTHLCDMIRSVRLICVTVTHSCMWYMWLIHVCDIAQFIYVTWLISVTWIIYVTWLAVCGWYAWLWLIHVCDIAQVIYVTWLINIWNITHTHECHDSYRSGVSSSVLPAHCYLGWRHVGTYICIYIFIYMYTYI